MHEEIGRKLKALRLRKNLHQDELADILEVSRVHICNIENGKRGLNLEQLNKLCKYFKISISYFVEEELTDECESLIESATVLFGNKELTQDQKDDLFSRLLDVYMNSKDNLK